MKNIWSRHKGKIIAAVIAVAVLTGAFFWGGNYSKHSFTEAEAATASTPTFEPSSSESAPPAPDSMAASSENASGSVPEAPETAPAPSAASDKTPSASPDPKVSGSVTGDNPAYASADGNGKTAPVTSGEPAPVEPQNAAVSDTQMTCTLSVSCSTILNNMNLLDKDKRALVPADGSIFAAKTVTFYEGETVFNVLQREMKKAGIQMEFEDTPMYNSAYIEGIDNIYEFDAGELSGWEYQVNGWFPNYGCSRYQLHDGDVVQWLYTCDLGKDVGGNNSTGS